MRTLNRFSVEPLARMTRRLADVAAGRAAPDMGFNLIPLAVIPQIRITDRGVVRVPEMSRVPLFEPA